MQFKAIKLFTIDQITNLFDILLPDTREQMFTIERCTRWLNRKSSEMHEKPISSANAAKTKLLFARIYVNTTYK